jgi:F420-dependent oxidoreductase-like protein
MELCVMIEGQEGVTWDQWIAIATACEEGGIPALFRSDHYLPLGDDLERDALDAWAVICALAAVTSRLRLGSLVSPAGFRHPSLLAKVVASADQISSGRIELGLGAGWNDVEHKAFGFPFPPTPQRLEVFAEQLEVIAGLWTEEGFAFEGEHYTVNPPTARPRPVQRPRVPIIVGGLANPKSAALAARWADEYNTFYATPDECRRRRGNVLDAVVKSGRDPDSMRFSLMTGCIIGRDDAEVRGRLARLSAEHGREPEESWIVGTPDVAVEQLRALADVGVDRVMLQLLLHDDSDQIGLIGAELIPGVV